MDPNDQKIINAVETIRQNIFHDLAEVLLQGLKDNSITMEQSREMARYVNQNLRPAKTQEEVIKFLENFSSTWEVYKNACIKIIYQEKEKETQAKLAEIQQKLHQFSSL